MLSKQIINSIDESVLCWLATTDRDGFPNCSPKEVFTWRGEAHLLIADIASPESVRNINANPKVCVSFVHVLKQKGFKIKGDASYVAKDAEEFAELYGIIKKLSGDFPVKGIIQINITSTQPIIAPSYLLVKGTTEESQIAAARKTYNL